MPAGMRKAANVREEAGSADTQAIAVENARHDPRRVDRQPHHLVEQTAL